MKVGGFAIDTILFVTHTIEDGQPVVECLDDTGEVRIFQFDPSVEPFRNTAVDIDGLPVCIDC